MLEVTSDQQNKNLCPVCREENFKQTSSFGNSNLYQCCNCQHRFIILPSLTSEILENLYDSDYAGYHPDPFFQAVIRQEIAKNFIVLIPPHGQILDVGCGNGDFLVAAREAGYTVCGIDISNAAIAHCKNLGLAVQKAEFVNFHAWEEFDCITMWDLLEHLPDPDSFINRAFTLLRPGGYLVIKTPYISEQTFSVVRAFPCLSGILLSTPEHLQFFNHETLKFLLQKNGFDCLDWLQDQRMRSQAPLSSFKKLVARLIVKLVALFGQSGNLYVMAHKPSLAVKQI